MQPAHWMEEPDWTLLTGLMRSPTRHMFIGKGAARQHSDEAQRLVKRLKEHNAYAGWRLEVDRKAMGMAVTAFIFVQLKSQNAEALREFRKSVEGHRCVMQVHVLSGEYDFMLETIGETVADIDAFRLRMVNAHHLVQGTRTMISLE